MSCKQLWGDTGKCYFRFTRKNTSPVAGPQRRLLVFQRILKNIPLAFLKNHLKYDPGGPHVIF